jgi:hypothetical protein
MLISPSIPIYVHGSHDISDFRSAQSHSEIYEIFLKFTDFNGTRVIFVVGLEYEFNLILNSVVLHFRVIYLIIKKNA